MPLTEQDAIKRVNDVLQLLQDLPSSPGQWVPTHLRIIKTPTELNELFNAETITDLCNGDFDNLDLNLNFNEYVDELVDMYGLSEEEALFLCQLYAADEISSPPHAYASLIYHYQNFLTAPALRHYLTIIHGVLMGDIELVRNELINDPDELLTKIDHHTKFNMLDLAIHTGNITMIKLVANHTRIPALYSCDEMSFIRLLILIDEAETNGLVEGAEFLKKFSKEVERNKKNFDFYFAQLDIIKENDTELAKHLFFAAKEQNNDLEKEGCLVFAAEYGNLALCEFYLDQHVNVNAVEEGTNEAPLLRAVLNNHLEVCELLLARGADVNIHKECLWSPLLGAASAGYTDIARLLIRYKAELDVQCGLGRTALHHAVKNECLEIVAILIEAKAALMIQDKKGKTPLDLAKKTGNKAIIKMLEGAIESTQSQKEVVKEDASVLKAIKRLKVFANHFSFNEADQHQRAKQTSAHQDFDVLATTPNSPIFNLNHSTTYGQRLFDASFEGRAEEFIAQHESQSSHASTATPITADADVVAERRRAFKFTPGGSCE